MAGMAVVLANFHPRELWLGVNSSSPELQTLLREAMPLGIPITLHKAGDTVGGAKVAVLAPPRNAEPHASRPNDESLVLKVSYGETSALLEGDAKKKTEKQVAQEKPQANVLKVAHHGSATSPIPELLAAVHPHFAVISVGAQCLWTSAARGLGSAGGSACSYLPHRYGGERSLSIRRQNRQLSVGGSSLRANSAVSSSSGV
jgi:competence protein ComEC